MDVGLSSVRYSTEPIVLLHAPHLMRALGWALATPPAASRPVVTM